MPNIPANKADPRPTSETLLASTPINPNISQGNIGVNTDNTQTAQKMHSIAYQQMQTVRRML
ncbi:MAG: hypothetical protein RR263_04335 [Oscillospiraceae bacterium]